MDLATGEKLDLSHTLRNSGAFSPDGRFNVVAQATDNGKRILYHRQQGMGDEGGYIFDLIVHDMETGQKTQLTDGDYEQSYPAWAPDGRHIVYSSDIDGKFIYFNSDRAGATNIYRLLMDGIGCVR